MQQEFITVTYNRTKIAIRRADILYAIMSDDHCTIHMFDGMAYRCRMTLKELKMQLNEGFMEVKRGCIFAKGEYQWVAQITNTLVFADPENMDARYLCADALEQLGYQAESGPWRSAYLCAAQELRNGTNTDDATRGNGNGDVILHMTPEMILDYLGILVDTTKVPDLTFTANLILPEGNYVLRVKNGVLLYQKDTQDADADVTWTTKRAGLLSIVQKNAENVAALIQQEGDETCLTRLMDAVTVTSEYKYFNIIEP